jgi:hexosaminidase
MSRSGEVYLDFDYVVTPLSKCYAYEPVPAELEPQFHPNVIGIETPLWTEWVRDVRRVHALTFPRLMAVAETGWTPRARKNFPDFKLRLAAFVPRLDARQIAYTPLAKTETNPLRRAVFYLHMLREAKDSEFA